MFRNVIFIITFAFSSVIHLICIPNHQMEVGDRLYEYYTYQLTVALRGRRGIQKFRRICTEEEKERDWQSKREIDRNRERESSVLNTLLNLIKIC